MSVGPEYGLRLTDERTHGGFTASYPAELPRGEVDVDMRAGTTSAGPRGGGDSHDRSEEERAALHESASGRVTHRKVARRS
jgi:hypothetical protein